jgi:hypothetical protein
MLGFGTTAGKIDDFEARFTVVNGAHFLIAGNGREAWPITAGEAEAFKSRYWRRMGWARWIRRITVGTPILLILFGNAAWLPQPVRAVIGTVAALLILCALAFGIQQHSIVSFLTKAEIERDLRHRIATGMPAALIPNMTPLGRFARRLLFIAVAMEIGLGLLHLLLGPTIFAEFLGFNDGNGGYANLVWLIWLTPTLSSLIHAGLLAAVLLLVLDRWSRRQAAKQARASGLAAGRSDLGLIQGRAPDQDVRRRGAEQR